MMLRRAGLGLLVGAVLMASSGALPVQPLSSSPITARCSTRKIQTPSGSRRPSPS